MAGQSESPVAYADDVAQVLGDAATRLQNAAAALVAQLAPGATVTPASWAAARAEWHNAQQALDTGLRTYLADGLPSIPGLDDLITATGWDSLDGVRGIVPVGPLSLSFDSSALVIAPPAGAGTTAPVALGPHRPRGIALSLDMLGGRRGSGALVRVTDGFGGAIELPLGIVQVDGTALLQRTATGDMSFLGILGTTFTPPIQLSLGFSLDRVGGLVGINRRADVDALARAVRTGTAGDLLFAAQRPASPTTLVTTANSLFPPAAGRHLMGPSVKLGWISLGSAGSFLAASVGVVVEVPTGKVVAVGSAQATIPGLSDLLHLRLDVMGVLDPQQQLLAIEASLVDSHAFDVFRLTGDAALRVYWGATAYSVLSVGGFYPGYTPEPARLPALRRVGMSMRNPLGIIRIRAEGYLAVTTNSIQLGGRLDVHIGLGIEANGFLQVDALVQFRPFRFEAKCSAGFDVSVGDFSFGGIRLDATLSGPGPLTLSGRLTIETFLLDFSWAETITIGGGSPDQLPTPGRLLDRLALELAEPHNLRAENAHDPDVVLEPEPGSTFTVVPPTGALRFEQRCAPLSVHVDRVDGRPLASRQRVKLTTPGQECKAPFAPGSYLTLTDSEALSMPPFENLVAGAVLTPGVQPGSIDPPVHDTRTVRQIVIYEGQYLVDGLGKLIALADTSALVEASHAPPALGDNVAVVTARTSIWHAVSTPGAAPQVFENATAAYQFAKDRGGFAVVDADRRRPVDLTGV